MKIDKDIAVTISYTLSESSGRLLEQSKGSSAYLHGGYGDTFEKIEQALQGQEAGYSVSLTLLPTDAFGERDESLVQSIPKSEFPPGVKVGGQLRGRTQDGRELAFYVTKIKGAQVLLDGNHPHAGKTLQCAIKVLKVRAASAEEIAHGHVHGDGGHHH
jgi:FKBP-type peptidyl-prolyl cis-trans isomerase SlyD